MTYERPICESCRKRPADVVEEGVKLCGKCFRAYHNVKVKGKFWPPVRALGEK